MPRPVYLELAKQPSEEIVMPGFDFADQVESSEVISSALVKVFEYDRSTQVVGPETTAAMKPTSSEQINGTNVSWRVKAGDHNKDYMAEVVATLSTGRTLNGVVIFGVRDRPY